MSTSENGDWPGAVLFDMDGTLIDSEHLWLKAEQQIMNDLGGSWTDADQEHCLGGPLERVAEYMIASAGSTRSVQQVGLDLMDEVEYLMRRDPIIWRPGARELLTEATELGISTALVTASWRRLVMALHERLAQDIGADPFTVIVPGDEVSRGKPHPDPYLSAMNLLGKKPVDCMAIEDSPTGVAAAVASGCRVVAVPHIAIIEAQFSLNVVSSLAGETIQSLWQGFTP
jgi:beta-phosphoglucomutase-like phosphatase (HAD superfamily)